MTREAALSQVAPFLSYFNDCKPEFAIHECKLWINKIFDDHEAQLKAKENDLERQDMIIKCLSMDLDSKEKLLKAKDDEIRRLNNLYADTIKDLGDALIEIEKLKTIIEEAIRKPNFLYILKSDYPRERKYDIETCKVYHQDFLDITSKYTSFKTDKLDTEFNANKDTFDANLTEEEINSDWYKRYVALAMVGTDSVLCI